MTIIVEGKVKMSAKGGLDSGMFNACVMIDGQLAGQAPVNADGEYKLELDAETLPETAELIIVPSSVKIEEANKMALRKRIGASSFVAKAGKKGEFVLSDSFFLPLDFLDYIRRRTRKYHVHGTVYLEYPTYFSTLPGCRIDFYEVDPVMITPGKLPLIRRQDFLGSAYTRTDGGYDFNFKFGVLPLKPIVPVKGELEFTPYKPLTPVKPDLLFDYKPDIRARLYLFVNGVWTNIYDAPMTEFDWNIEPDFRRDYRVPADAAIGAVDPGSKPATGFRFKSIGLIPIDNTRIVDGYAHSQPGDPLVGITHEPFCHGLRIYGMFAAAPVVTNYTVEILRTDATGNAATGETWKHLGESLTNQIWNDLAKRWDPLTLGPIANKYRNVDIEDPLLWLETSLKVTWNTTNCVNGFYKLRITGYNAADTAVVTTEMPMIRIDNDVPDALLDVISPATTVCGNMTLGDDRTITLKVTAHEADGHLHSYYYYGTRGRYAESAGTMVTRARPVANDNWNGVIEISEPFVVSERTTVTNKCATMAYSIHLCVQGAGTNGYGNCLEVKRHWEEMNLVVTEVVPLP